MTASPLIVRAPGSLIELREHVQGNVEVNQAFSPEPLPEDTAERTFRWLTTLPGFREEQVRGAYRAGRQLGGYRIYERQLCIGAARLLTGCIGSVYTRAAFRNQGVATALMLDALQYARDHDYALLLLDGIPKFYHRFGYSDIYDLTTQELDRRAILALPSSPYIVRQPTLDDAPGLLALYRRQFGRYSGSFAHSLEQQAHWLQYRDPQSLLLAVDAAQQVYGYLYLKGEQARGPFYLAGAQLWELAADDWPATIALLQHHVRLVEGQRDSGPVLYSMPPASPPARWLAQHLEVQDISNWDFPTLGWSVREQTFRHRDAAWMACVVSLPALIRAMLPEWQTRWRRSLARWSGEFSLLVGEETFTLCLNGTDLELLDVPPGRSAHTLSLTPQAFVQALFGYSPLVDVLRESGQELSNELESVLTILFPAGQAWIPAVDWF